MSSKIAEKIKEIRKAEGLGRAEFADRVGISKNTLIGIERQGRDPRGETIQKIAEAYPEYAFWLITNKVQEEAGHYSPGISK